MKRENFVGQVIKSYTFIRLLGEGAWASVYEALDDRDNSTVAIKIIAQKLMTETPKLEELVKTEIKVLKSCANENVIKYVDSFKSGNSLFIATEYCNGGDLEQYLKLKKNLSEDEATTFLKQILNGFKGLHEVKAMHRDFKVANVLLHNSACKIADLGFAKQMEKKSMAKTILGTSLTMAPEVLDEKPYGFEADIWSIGVVYYQMLYGKYPYMGMNDYDILKKIRNSRPDFSKVNISANAQNFIDRCLCIDPKKRISWIEIYSHPLLANKNENFIYGTLKSKISINENKNFYQKNEFKNDPYPNLNNLDIGGVQFEKVDDIRQSINMEAVMQEAQRKKEKENLFQHYEKQYLHRRNDIMFIFKFVSPFVPNFYNVNANHGIAMFILSKNSYIEMKKFYNDLKMEKNIFGMPKYFNEFIQNNSYKNLTKQVESDIEIIGVQCSSYSCDISNCSNEISSEFNLDYVSSKNWNQLVKDTVEQYWFLLAEALESVKNDKRRDLIRVLQALHYFKNNKEIKAEEFDYLMTMLDFGVAEKDIQKQYQSVFQ